MDIINTIIDFIYLLFTQEDSNSTFAIIPAIIGAGASIVGSGISAISGNSTNKANARLAREQRNWQSGENDRAWQRNVDMWHMQNAYNDPKAHLERYENAGINPYMSLNNVGSAQTAPEANQTMGQPPARIDNHMGYLGNGVASAMSTLLDFKMKEAQIENVKADTDNKGVNSDYTISLTDSVRLNNDVLRATKDLIPKKMQAEIGVMNAQEWLFKAQENTEFWNTQLRKFDFEHMSYAKYYNTLAQTAVYIAQRDNIDFQTERGRYLMVAELAQLLAIAQLSRSQSKYYDMQERRGKLLMPYDVGNAKMEYNMRTLKYAFESAISGSRINGISWSNNQSRMYTDWVFNKVEQILNNVKTFIPFTSTSPVNTSTLPPVTGGFGLYDAPIR